MSKTLNPTITAAFLGLATGDALGVPVEFQSRENLKKNPVEVMMGFGTWNQMPGTFSDDSSLTFCLADALIEGFDLNRIARYFASWKNYGLWAARGFAFSIGTGTLKALQKFENGTAPELAGGDTERDNGNGSLMRILPMAFFCLNEHPGKRFELVQKVSAITHRHIRAVIACFYYTEFARELLSGKDKFKVYKELQNRIPSFLDKQKIPPAEIEIFHRLLRVDITEFKEEEIHSGGYVLDTLEATIWCLLTTGSYKEAVLKAVNLGGDTDTTGAVTGGLAGILYGKKGIPAAWLRQLEGRKEIEQLALQFGTSLRK